MRGSVLSHIFSISEIVIRFGFTSAIKRNLGAERCLQGGPLTPTLSPKGGEGAGGASSFTLVSVARKEDYQTERARSLRRAQTPPEGVLWSRLKRRQLGNLKFRRQHSVGRFVVDFYCAEARLVVELDSSYHDGRRAQDEARDRELEARGLKVLRVTVSELSKDQDAVLATVLRVAWERIEELKDEEKR